MSKPFEDKSSQEKYRTVRYVGGGGGGVLYTLSDIPEFDCNNAH